MSKNSGQNTDLEYVREKIDTLADTATSMLIKLETQKITLDSHIQQEAELNIEFTRMNNILSENTLSLVKHMHRTEVAEARLHILEEFVKSVDARIAPIEKNIIEENAIKKYRNEKLKKIGKILGLVGGITTVIISLKEYINF